MIKVISDINELKEIRDYWSFLYEEDDNCTPFQSFDYIFISWNRFCQKGNSLFVILFCQKKRKKILIQPDSGLLHTSSCIVLSARANRLRSSG